MMPLGLIFSLWMAPQVDTCISVRGNEILARDLSAAGFLFSLLDPNTVFGLTPRPGSRRVLSSRELAAVVSRSGIAIGADAEFTSGICVERAAGILSAGEIRTALASAVGDDHAQIEVLDYTREPLPPGQLQFKTSGVSRTGTPFVVIWYGRLTYDPGRSLAIWA